MEFVLNSFIAASLTFLTALLTYGAVSLKQLRKKANRIDNAVNNVPAGTPPMTDRLDDLAEKVHENSELIELRHQENQAALSEVTMSIKVVEKLVDKVLLIQAKQ